MIFLDRAMISKLCRQNSAQLLFRVCATSTWSNFVPHCSKNTRRRWCLAAFSNRQTTFESGCVANRSHSAPEWSDSVERSTICKDKKNRGLEANPRLNLIPVSYDKPSVESVGSS